MKKGGKSSNRELCQTNKFAMMELRLVFGVILIQIMDYEFEHYDFQNSV